MPTPSLLQRLKERKLVQWALAYLVFTVGALGAMDALETPLGLSPTVQQRILVVLVVGFFITLVLAWYHGEKGDQRVSRSELFILVSLLLVGGVGLSILPGSSGPERVVQDRRDDGRPVIAVLPLQNLSPSSDYDYFAKGAQEALTEKLQRIPSIKVISRTSADRIGDSDTRPPTPVIADSLNVDYLIEGSARIDGDSVRVTIQLIEGPTDHHLWAENFDDEYTTEGYVRVQSRIVQKIVHDLRQKISPEDVEWLDSVPTRNLAAYEAYMKGVESFRRERQASVGNLNLPSEQLLTEAISLDPDFGLAYAHLALALSYSPEPGHWGRAQRAGEKALALTGGVPEAHLALFRALGYGGIDLEKSGRQMEMALELAPENVLVLREYGELLEKTGNEAEAIEVYRRAEDLDPLDPLIPRSLGELFIKLHRWDEALDSFDDEIAHSGSGGGRALLFQAYVHMARGDLDRARAALTELLNLAPRGPYAYVPYSGLTAVKSLMTPTERQDALNAFLAGSGEDAFVTLKTWEKQWFTAMHEHEFGSAERARVLFDSLYVTLAEHTPMLNHPRRGLILMGVGERDAALTAARAMIPGYEPRCRSDRGAFDRCRTAARILAHFGEFDEAINLIEEMLPTPSYLTVHLLEADRVWDPLRDHPRFQALLEEYADDVEH